MLKSLYPCQTPTTVPYENGASMFSLLSFGGRVSGNSCEKLLVPDVFRCLGLCGVWIGTWGPVWYCDVFEHCQVDSSEWWWCSRQTVLDSSASDTSLGPPKLTFWCPLSLFHKVYKTLVPGGSFLLEPQPWSSYRKKRLLTPEITINFKVYFASSGCFFPIFSFTIYSLLLLKAIELKPVDFEHYLIHEVRKQVWWYETTTCNSHIRPCDIGWVCDLWTSWWSTSYWWLCLWQKYRAGSPSFQEIIRRV